MKYIVIKYLSLFTYYVKKYMLGTLSRDGVEVMDMWRLIYGCGYTIIDTWL